MATKKNKGIKAAIIAVALYFLFLNRNNVSQVVNSVTGSTFNVGQITAKFNGFDTQYLIPTHLRLELQIPVSNNTPVPARFDRFTGNIFFGNQNVGQADSNEAISAPANQKSIAKMRVRASVVELIAAGIDIIKDRDFLRSIRVEGILKSGLVDLPVNTSVI